MERTDKVNYYLNIAQEVAKRGTCLRRNYGAIIVKNDEIVATGYTGAPRGVENCCDRGVCQRQALNIPSGERYELCRSVHAEQNAIISAARKDMIGATLYLTGLDAESGNINSAAECCSMCRRMIVNAGIDKVIIRRNETDYDVQTPSLWSLFDGI